jgi:mannose-6-phosphate isomerase-like protein (cupin superfamily)
MPAFDVTTLLQEHSRADKLYLEFLRKSALSLGLYRLPAGGVDPQSPHTEDEVYYVVSGRAQIRVGDEDRSVGPGSIVFVAAHVPHRFHTIEEELIVLVFFAPAEYSNRHGAP